jgi:hypothetical protein
VTNVPKASPKVSPKVSGFTIVRNAVKLDFPLEASIRSILPICDEMVVAVGRSDDGTLDLVRAIGDPKIRIVETEWDMTIKSKVLADETLRAMRACRYPWGIYIQADEVLHERGAEALAAAIRRHDADPRVEGLLVRYVHFYGGMDRIAVNRRWYRREVRAVRLDPALEILPFQDAQGFRVGAGHRKIRARLTEAEMFHYGWARPPEAIRRKREEDKALFPRRKVDPAARRLPWIPGIRRFAGTHPAVARDWVDARREATKARIDPPQFRWRFVRYYISGVIERLTGVRVFEFRNYTMV